MLIDSGATATANQSWQLLCHGLFFQSFSGYAQEIVVALHRIWDHIIYWDSKLLVSGFFLFCRTGSWAVWPDQYALYTRCLPKPARKELNFENFKSCYGLTVQPIHCHPNPMLLLMHWSRWKWLRFWVYSPNL